MPRRPSPGAIQAQRRLPALTLALVCIGAIPAAAQTVRGRLLDAATERPVPGAVVRLLAGETGEDEPAAVVADSLGRFRLRAPAAGRYRLRTERIGYRTVTSPPFDLSVEAPLEVELRIAAEAIPLAPLKVLSERQPLLLDMRLEIRGYYERKETWGKEGMGFGHFLEGEDILRRNPSRVSDVLRGIPGVHVEGAGGREQTIKLRSVGPGGRCVPTVYVDGVPAATGADIDDLILPSSLVAVEVYPGLAVPGQFMRGACGAVVVWTGR